MTDEIKEAKTVAEAFNIQDEVVKEVVEDVTATDQVNASVDDETQKGEVEVKSEAQATEKQESEPAKTEPTWTELGLPQYEGMTKAEIAERISFVNKEYGRATNTIGELRKQINTAVSDTSRPSEAKEAKQNIVDSMPKLSTEDTIRFNQVYEESPVKAIMMFGGDSVIKKIAQDEISARVPKDIDTIFNEKLERLRYESFLEKHSLTENSPEVVWINEVKTNYLTGQNRPIEELYELSQMWKNKDETTEPVYTLMKKHPTMSLDEAKSFVRKPNPNAVDKAQIVNNVKKLNNVNHTSRTAKVSDDTMKTFNSVQEAFDSVE